MEVPQPLLGLLHGKSQRKMDDWGYPESTAGASSKLTEAEPTRLSITGSLLLTKMELPAELWQV